jgi:hypothetical protein
MKWLLIAAALNMNVVYQDEKTCEIAAEKLNDITEAVCIPLGESQKQEKFADRMDIFFDKFLDIVEKIKQFEEKHEDPKKDSESDQKQVDNSVKSVYNT